MNTKVLLITGVRRRGWLEESDDPGVAKLYTFSKDVSIAEPSVDLSVTSLDRLQFTIDGDSVSIFDDKTQCDISYYDVVQLRNTDKSIMNYADYAKAITVYVQHKGGLILDPQDAGAPFGKLAQAVLFALNGIPTPKTWASWYGDTLAHMIASNGVGFPVIAKSSMGTMGADNYLVKDQTELNSVLSNAKVPFVVQEHIPNDGDYRVLILGRAEPFIFWRPRIPGSHLSNTSQGSVPDKNVTLGIEALAIAHDAQRIVERTCVGVDIMQNSQTGQWLVLEANNNPALATGAFMDDKAARYAEMIKRLSLKDDEN